MDTKTCPACGTEVPSVANRCRSCFHDFTEKKPGFNASGPLTVLAGLALVALVGAGTFWWLSTRPTDTRILVDGASRTVQWIEQYQDGRLHTDRVKFDDVRKIVLRISPGGGNVISVHLADGSTRVVESNRTINLQLKAEEYARIVGLPLEVQDETRLTFGGE